MFFAVTGGCRSAGAGGGKVECRGRRIDGYGQRGGLAAAGDSAGGHRGRGRLLLESEYGVDGKRLGGPGRRLGTAEPAVRGLCAVAADRPHNAAAVRLKTVAASRMVLLLLLLVVVVVLLVLVIPVLLLVQFEQLRQGRVVLLEQLRVLQHHHRRRYSRGPSAFERVDIARVGVRNDAIIRKRRRLRRPNELRNHDTTTRG